MAQSGGRSEERAVGVQGEENEEWKAVGLGFVGNT